MVLFLKHVNLDSFSEFNVKKKKLTKNNPPKKHQSIFEYMDAMMEGKMQFLLCTGWQKGKFLYKELVTAKAD